MKVYHGTAYKALPYILKHGIKPRQDNEGNWPKAISREGFVYMTTCYPLYYAIQATKDNSKKIVIFEVETDLLRQSRLAPDEDFIGSVLSLQLKISIEEGMAMCLNPLDWRHEWRKGVANMGNCCYFGKIPLKAITRYAIIDTKNNVALLMRGMDPSISLMNYRLMSETYLSLVAHVFDGAEIHDNKLDFEPTLEACGNNEANFKQWQESHIQMKAELARLQELRATTVEVVELTSVNK